MAREWLDLHRGNGRRFWDHTLPPALGVGDEDLALALLRAIPVNQSYR